MGTTAQKLEYLKTTKSQLKDMINNGLDDDNKITSSTTFREYVSSVFNAFLETLRTPSTLFNNLPKKSGNGTQIILNGTANAPMRIELGATELTQDGTPSPSNPQDVHTISGSNKILISNKFDKTLLQLGAYSYGTTNIVPYFTGSTDTRFTLSPTNAIKVKPNTTYTFNTTYNQPFAIGQMTSEKISLGDTGWKQTSTLPFSFTTSATTEYIGFNFQKSSSTTLDDIVSYNYQIDEGTFEEYTSQEANIDLKSVNLVDFSSPLTVSGTYTFENDIVTMSGTGSWRYVTFDVLDVIKNNAGKIIEFVNEAVDLTEFNSSSVGIVQLTIINNGTTSYPGLFYANGNHNGYTIPSDTSGITSAKLYLYCNNSGTLTTSKVVITKPMLKLMEDANIYSSYYDIDYCKRGNYEDKFIRTSGKNVANALDVSSMINFTKSGDTFTTSALTSSGYGGIGSTTFTNSVPITESGTAYFSADIRLVSGTAETLNGIWDKALTRTNASWVNKPTLSNQFQRYCYKYDVNAGDSFTGFAVQLYNCSSAVLEVKNIMFSYSNDYEYEPYGTNEWYIKKKIVKDVLDGSETYGYQNDCFIYNSNAVLQTSSTNEILVKSNYYNGAKTNYRGDIANFNVAKIVGANTQIGIKDNRFTTTSDFSSWVSSNNVTLYYVLATPTYTKISGTLENQLENIYQKLLSYKGTTNISQVNYDLAFNLSASALEDLE